MIRFEVIKNEELVGPIPCPRKKANVKHCFNCTDCMSATTMLGDILWVMCRGEVTEDTELIHCTYKDDNGREHWGREDEIKL